MSETLIFTVSDFLKAFDAPAADSGVIARKIEKYDFRYTRLNQTERASVIKGIRDQMADFTEVGPHRLDIWERCWIDATATYEADDSKVTALDPSFMGATPVLRLGGDYAKPHSPDFEIHWFRVLRHWIISRYLSGFERVFEFGCGSGFNLVSLARMYPEMELTGLDWSSVSVNLVDKIAKDHGYKLCGRHFDFFDPDPDLKLGDCSAVLTFAALEQTGENFKTFGEWLLARKPELVISMEPVFEFYDEENEFDRLALRYHTARKYLKGYYPWLREQEKQGRVEILKAHRCGFGSLYNEGYSLLIWKPQP